MRNELKTLYNNPVPISKEKKKDLMDIIELLKPVARSFYSALVVDNKLKNTDPDLPSTDMEDNLNDLNCSNDSKKKTNISSQE